MTQAHAGGRPEGRPAGLAAACAAGVRICLASGRRLMRAIAVVAIAVTLPVQASRAQQKAGEPASQAVDASTPPAADAIDGLVARVALYPDPLLALVLQASTLPLEIVQATRFLEKRAEDPSLKPDPGWD